MSNFSKSMTCYQQMKRTHHLSNPGPYIASDIQECNYEFALHIFYPLNGVKKNPVADVGDFHKLFK